MLPWEFKDATKANTRSIPWNIHNTLRCLVSFILVFLKLGQTLHMAVEILQPDLKTFVIANALAPSVQFLSHLLLLTVYEVQRRHGKHTSGYVWVYLLALTLCQTVDYYSVILSIGQIVEYKRLFSLTIDLLHFPLLVLLFGLECRGDKPPAVPYRHLEDLSKKLESPELKASFCSQLLYTWFNDALIAGYKRRINSIEDVWRVLPQEQVARLTSKFEQFKQNDRINILGSLFRQYGSGFAKASLLRFGQDILLLTKPVILKLLLQFMSNQSDEPFCHGLIYSGLLLFLPTIQSILTGAHYYYMFGYGNQVRNIIMGAVYRKSLRLSASSRSQSTGGELVNLMSVDSSRVQDLLSNLTMFWSSIFQIVVAIMLIYRELGWAVFAGFFTMILLMPIHAVIARYSKRAQTRLMKKKDERTKQVGEMLAGIRLIKLYAWENSFIKSLCGYRSQELSHLKLMLNASSLMSFLWQSSPFIVSLVTFAVYTWQDPKHQLTPEKAFVTIALFNILKMPIMLFPAMISILIYALVATKRLNNYLNCPELVSYVTREHKLEAISIEGGCATWSLASNPKEDSKPILRDIDLHVENGSLVAIVGQVASGKSSLLSSILGEMHCISGRFNIAKSQELAYVPQQAWIQNLTVKQNILFGKQLDANRYERVLDACALKLDLATLPASDETEIGERGINLSGGQKQRVSLARACYSASNLYLLDDPLSALDSHVARHVFDNVLSSNGGLLAGKTRLLATNSLFVLPHADKIVVLKEGRIVECGSYKELMEKQDGQLNEMMQHYGLLKEESKTFRSTGQSVNDKNHGASSIESDCNGEKNNHGTDTGRLIENEHMATGGVVWRVYLSYFRAASLIWMLTMFVLSITATGFSVTTNVWLSFWSGDSDRDTMFKTSWCQSNRLLVYALLGASSCLLILLANLALALGSVKASGNLHKILLDGVMHSSMAFFDTTPKGRIVNRFAKDTDIIDTAIPNSLKSTLTSLFEVLSTVLVIIFSFPSFIIILIPISIFYYFIQKVFISTSRQLKRLESITRSPIYSHFQETLAGTGTIRAYNSENMFISHSDELIDTNQSCQHASLVANRWLAIRLEFFGNIITTAAALFSVYNKGSIEASLAGLTVSYSLGITTNLAWIIRMSSDLETNIVSVERVLEYAHNDSEDHWVKQQVPNSLTNWPPEGSIIFQDFSTRYRDNTELVLRRLNLSIGPGEKIGIVGRTGSGKSSLALSLFRILEAAGGRILIDGLDIAKLGLHELRSKLTIIPQDPVLFSGSLRFNLDPLGASSDDDIWRSLELAHLKSQIATLPDGLDHKVSEYGENLSLGQRQLICLARAILRKSKIFVLDEATASVDTETDGLVQRTIRQTFGGCTVITIAHRLHTIMDSDRVLVLEEGVIGEMGPPSVLATQRNGIFASMLLDAGIQL